ncbi:hypothetical protein SAMN03159341_1283 [Paenibacillus sp. 1_12]|uniref:hypothetical protein n=1 Tax=Paenibacillus sp. 1_12 TaxID=1566278 RepID=UPI0008E661B3|nr:hypothetical protein SAMN03159341_1283 [Paenibacillus sp. 1_12]
MNSVNVLVNALLMRLLIRDSYSNRLCSSGISKTTAEELSIENARIRGYGIWHIAYAVEHIEAVVGKLKKKGMEIFSEIQNYEERYKLCYCRVPEGIILDLAERIK